MEDVFSGASLETKRPSKCGCSSVSMCVGGNTSVCGTGKIHGYSGDVKRRAPIWIKAIFSAPQRKEKGELRGEPMRRVVSQLLPDFNMAKDRSRFQMSWRCSSPGPVALTASC